MPCPVCQHNQVKNIDRALLAGADPASLCRTYGCSPAALERHQQHLQQKMARASARFHDHLHLGLFCKLTQVMEMVLFVVRQAKTGGDFKFFLQASREFTRLMSLMHKMAAKLSLDPEFISCLLASPQWDLQEDSLLPQAIQALNHNRQSLKLNLFAPCPEPEPVPDPASDTASSLTPPSPTPAPPAAVALEPAAGPVRPVPGRRDAGETEVGQKWDRIGTKTGPIQLVIQNNDINQYDILREKSTGPK
jgi:hypothetical protein